MVCSLRIAISTSDWYSMKNTGQMEEENVPFPKERSFPKRHQKNGNHFINTSCDEVCIKQFAAKKGKLREWSQVFNRDYRIYYNIRRKYSNALGVREISKHMQPVQNINIHVWLKVLSYQAATFWNGLDTKFKVLSSIDDFKESIQS